MEGIKLTPMEKNKYTVIKNLVENNGCKKRASIKLNCTIRTIYRLISLYKKNGDKGFIHKNRNRLPQKTFSLSLKNKITNLYINEYKDANITHFCEIIKQELDVTISDSTVRKWLLELDVISPKAKRKTKKKLKAKLKALQNKAKSKKEKNSITEQLMSIEDDRPHSRRPRSKYMGEIIQMDASSFEWVPGEIWHLHLAVDDASGAVVGAYFDTQETLKGYYNVFYQILCNYGIPATFYTDRRTIFEYKKKSKVLDNEDTFTQFSYACHNLGVEIKTTSIAQAKGRIERLHQTFQSRLPIELRRARITSMANANDFLKSYIKEYNDMFALQLNNTSSVFEVQPPIDKINQFLSVISKRKVDQGNCIKFKNKYWMAYDEDDKTFYLKPKIEVLVIESFDGKIYANADDNLYILKEVPTHQKFSKDFDQPIEVPKPKKNYIPPLSHPWRKYSYQLFIKKRRDFFPSNIT